MQTYRPKIVLLLSALFLSAIFLGPAGFLCTWLWQHTRTAVDLNEVCLFGFAILVLADFGLVFLFAGLQATASFQTDSDGITRRAFWGTQRLEWRNLEGFEIVGESESDISLRDRAGGRMEIPLTCLLAAEELREDLERQIAPLRDGLLRQWWSSGATFRSRAPFSPAGEIFLVILAVGSFCGCFLLLRSPGDATNPRPVLIGTAVLCLAFALLMVWTCLYIFSRTLKLSTDGIEIDSLVFRRKIAFSDIVSVTSREVQSQHTSTRLNRVRGRDGKSILFNVYTPNASLLTEYLQTRAGEKAREAGAEEIRAETQKSAKTSKRFLLFASPLYIGMFLGIPLWLMMQGRQRIADYNRIEAQGVPATATIAGKSTSGSKNTEYVLEYTLPVRNASGQDSVVKGASPVRYEVWETTRPGTKMGALYVPGDVRLRHLKASVSNEHGKGAIRAGIMYLAMGAVGTLLYIYLTIKAILKERGKWEDPAPPEQTVRLDDARLNRVREEIKRIALARSIGLYIMYGGMALFLLMGLSFLLLEKTIPALHALNEPHSPCWIDWLLVSPGIAAVAGLFVFGPLGELYAGMRSRAVESDLPDPRLSRDLVQALRRSVNFLGGAASLRLLNALTAILRERPPELRELSPEQRAFLYLLLRKWQGREDRAAYCIALLNAFSIWNDRAGLSAIRTAATSNLPEVQEAASRGVASHVP